MSHNQNQTSPGYDVNGNGGNGRVGFINALRAFVEKAGVPVLLALAFLAYVYMDGKEQRAERLAILQACGLKIGPP